MSVSIKYAAICSNISRQSAFLHTHTHTHTHTHKAQKTWVSSAEHKKTTLWPGNDYAGFIDDYKNTL